MSKEAMKALPATEWMPLSKKPPVHQWLLPNMDEATKSRLKVAGNVVMPPMAYFAAMVLSTMTCKNLESYTDAHF